MQVSAAIVESSMELTALWPSDSTSGNLSEETQNTNFKEYMSSSVHCSTIYNSQGLEATQVYIVDE